MSVTVTPLSPDFSVAPQLSVEDMAGIKSDGYKSIIINRPDFEGGADQPTSEAIIAAAKAIGLTVVYQPVASGQISSQDVAQFAHFLKTLPTPIVAYCRSGTRCGVLYNGAVNFSN